MAEIFKPDYNQAWAATGQKATLTNATITAGWTQAKPSFQVANSVENRQDWMLQHIDQHGIPMWGATTEYYANRSYVMGSDGEIYRAVTDSYAVNPVGDTSNKWYRVLDEFFTKTQSDARYLGLAVPSGAVFHFAMQTAPAGYLVCNGAAVSRTAFASLFAAIGTLYGNGDGSTTFNLPDLRGEFIRGADLGRGVDSGRVFGSGQASMVGPHKHNMTYKRGSEASAGVTEPDGFLGIYSDTFIDTFTNTGVIDMSTGTETRPRNVALLPCIKT